jgi:tRNA-splicing ligase RtcB
MSDEVPLRKIDDHRWEIPADARPGMRVSGLVYADEGLLAHIRKDKALEQVANVATMPGIVKASIAMPDIHWGYGFCVGGVAAFDAADGVVSPGGVGYDVNCGIRLVRSDIRRDEAAPRVREIVAALYRNVPCGVGVDGAVRAKGKDLRRLAERGAAWAVEQGRGVPADLEATEGGGALDGADPDAVSDRAAERGGPQVGSLGAGNHFLEVQVVDEVRDAAAADAFGLFEGQVVVMIHTGSRGYGHQVCDDHLRIAGPVMARAGIRLPDRQLACLPIASEEGRRYVGAMRAAANYAWTNRQVIHDLVRRSFEEVFGRGWTRLGLDLVYDHAHNIAKFETHEVDGAPRRVCVHRKGATRAFPAGHAELPERYRAVGQPVLVPGSMGTASWVLAGAAGAMRETFGTTCHGAGRAMSRKAATKAAKERSIHRELEDLGVTVMARSRRGLDEEQPAAYKDVDAVIRVVGGAGLARPVARLRPVGVVKG